MAFILASYVPSVRAKNNFSVPNSFPQKRSQKKFFCDNSPPAGASRHKARGVLSHDISFSLRDLMKQNCNVLNKILLKALNTRVSQ